MYDINALLDAASAYDVAMYIGMNVVKRGTKYCIACPGHEKRLGKPDTHIGNAVLTNKGYHCYACGCQVGLVDMVQEFTGCSFMEALETIGDACGGAALFKTDKRPEEVKLVPLTNDDLKTIGLQEYNAQCKSNHVLVNASDEEPKREDGMIAVKRDGVFYVYRRVHGWSLNRLCQENETKFNNIVMFAARQSMSRYKHAIDVFCTRDAKKIDDVFDVMNDNGALDDEDLTGIRNALQKKYYRARDIYLEYAGKVKTGKENGR